MKPIVLAACVLLACRLLSGVARADEVVDGVTWTDVPDEHYRGKLPDWIDEDCHGFTTERRMDASDVTHDEEGYHFKGYPRAVTTYFTRPSRDGAYWIFYFHALRDGQPWFSRFGCFYVP